MLCHEGTRKLNDRIKITEKRQIPKPALWLALLSFHADKFIYILKESMDIAYIF